uniref:E3 ubiquitin-protein ligase TRIM39-like n=1 Tax=Podarcis muralis TaxID=64176 RepID=UPI0010A04514|nr:E3 ubiquitin-protein ligase TRIM39-like [Podarcis muralis]
MAAAGGHIQRLRDEATCSICLDYFKDPVTIPECGHNFCRSCLVLFWGESEAEASCPQCRERVQRRSLVSNRQLANVAEIVKNLSLQEGKEEGGKGGVCEKHQEPLKLFCKVHETPICVVCDKSKEHENHKVIPLEEASEEYKGEICHRLEILRKEREEILAHQADLDKESKDLLESTQTRQIAEGAKEKAVAVEEKLPPIQRQLDGHRSTLSMIELKEKQTNLRIRAVPEAEKDNLVDFLMQEIADFWKSDLEKGEIKIVRAFRLGGGGKKNRVRDCLITLRTKEERDKILSLHFQKTLVIHQSRVEIFKDIPKYLLDLRSDYRDLVGLLRSNRIVFRWEFPQGLSFSFKGRNTKIRSVDDKERFLRDHEEDLQKGSGEEPGVLERGILDKAILPLGLDDLGKVTPPTEQEQALGAVGGKAK